MLASSYKRVAPGSPDARPPKRQAISSPEEGELDDSTPPPSTRPAIAAGPSSPPMVATKGAKVPFPFKKKAAAPDARVEYPPDTRRPPPAYNRPADEDRRYREEDTKRYSSSRASRYDERATRGGDHWVPSHYDGKSRPAWDEPPYDDERSYYSRGVDRWEPRGDRPQHLISPRPRRQSRSPSTPRSPLSPESAGKEKHRLPKPSFQDNREYGDRDWNRSREPKRRRDSLGRSWEREWSDPYRREEDESRHYRRRHGSRDSRYAYDGRDQPYEDSRSGGAYHPISPHSPARPLSPQSLRDTRRGSRTPPVPAEAPPPAPPPDERLDALPTQHTTVKISLPKKPPTPVDNSSLLSAQPPSRQPPEEPVPPRLERKESNEPNVVRRARRKAVQRSREEEEAAYGHIFKGCGMQSDYDVITKLGEGTFGEVHKAVRRGQGPNVALKRILMHNEKEGMPVTALREIKILKSLHHENIVDILDMFVVRSRGKEAPLSVYMVFPYMDHDLAGLLENERVKLSPSQIKLYMKQLLEGTEYMHGNHILHRDMKAANLLISNTGSLKIADFGLARAFDPNVSRGAELRDGMHTGKERKYTNCVVTRWYRPPELLLGARQYGGEVDMWGIGCVLGEMFWRRPILPGTSDLDQLDKIWQLCGTPTQISWPNFDTLPGCEGVKRFNMYPRRLKQTYETIGPETCNLLDKLLTCNPRERITASQALDHDYFWTDPLPADPKTLPTYEASHEFDKRGRRSQVPVGPPLVPRVDVPSRPLPAPTQPPPPHYGGGRPPPPRDSYRNGPPHPHFSQGQGPGGPYPPRHIPPPPPLSALPPISLRPGQPPPQIWPAHLPLRPADPMGRFNGGRIPPRHEPPAGGELNYG